ATIPAATSSSAGPVSAPASTSDQQSAKNRPISARPPHPAVAFDGTGRRQLEDDDRRRVEEEERPDRVLAQSGLVAREDREGAVQQRDDRRDEEEVERRQPDERA